MPTPYDKYKKLRSWKIIEEALIQLQGNADLDLLTVSDYIVGYIIDKLDNKGLINE